MAEQPDSLHRRDFLRQSAATGAVLSLSAAGYARVAGSNERLGVAFLGCGARAQAHIDIVNRADGLNPVAVCDVWDGHEGSYTQQRGGHVTRRNYRQGLIPSAKRAKLNPADRTRVTRDYRRLLERRDVDLVCVSTPDHWQARMAIDAMLAGKDVYCETPMARTLTRADAVLETWRKTGRVMTVGCQSLADPTWATANALIRDGKIGHVAQAQAGVFRNDIRGWWRFYRTWPSQNPNTIDWPMFLGDGFTVGGAPIGPSAAEVPFDRAKLAQWRCYRDFSGGMLTDFFIHPVTRLVRALGVGRPERVVAAGGLFVEKDGRDVPDVATLCADFAEGCQLLVTGTTIAAYPIEEVIRGRRGALKFVKGGIQLIVDAPEGGCRMPARLEGVVTPRETIEIEKPKNETAAMWEDFVARCRGRDRATLCPPDLAADALAVVVSDRQSDQ